MKRSSQGPAIFLSLVIFGCVAGAWLAPNPHIQLAFVGTIIAAGFMAILGLMAEAARNRN